MSMNKSMMQFMFLTMFLILILGAALYPAPCEAAGKIVMVSTEGVKNSKYGPWLNLVFTEAFRRMGYKLEYLGYPAARASSLSNTGKVDGEISRVYSYQSTHPNLIRVDEVVYSTSFVAFASKPGIALNGWNSLKGTKYKVEYRRGVKLSESELSKIVAKDHLSNVTTAEQGLKKLIKGRTDLFVDVEFTIVDALNNLNPDKFKISSVYQAGVMQKVDAYVYLHKKNAALVPKLIKTLQVMKRKGLFVQYLKIASKLP